MLLYARFFVRTNGCASWFIFILFKATLCWFKYTNTNLRFLFKKKKNKNPRCYHVIAFFPPWPLCCCSSRFIADRLLGDAGRCLPSLPASGPERRQVFNLFIVKSSLLHFNLFNLFTGKSPFLKA